MRRVAVAKTTLEADSPMRMVEAAHVTSKARWRRRRILVNPLSGSLRNFLARCSILGYHPSLLKTIIFEKVQSLKDYNMS